MIHRIKRRKTFVFVIIFLFLIVVASCSPKENENQNKDKSKDTQGAPEQSENDETKENTTDSKESEDISEELSDPMANILKRAPEEPTNMEEIINYPVGPLAGKTTKDSEAMVKFVKDTLPPVEGEMDEAYMDKWWRAYNYLFANDYPDPNQFIKNMSFENFGIPGIEDERFQFKEQMNVLVILDVSGSMANTIDGAHTAMYLLKIIPIQTNLLNKCQLTISEILGLKMNVFNLKIK